ncbi:MULTISPECIES: dephospho-CoA kinase [Lactococcus]|uniref:dephospho-CoA kinase n=1 Tax=Lactococcus TaxID=1357 RepID=UPI000EC1BF01|nr:MULTISPECIES: dephospho-CoA kinase [Lactococcus]HAP16043.1 dephospho-CoA kinase [Lactococcus sp.]
MNKVIGLTGGIASGKSTVVDFLRSQGYLIIDADQVVRELQAPGGLLYQAIMQEFGGTYFDEKGLLNRRKLGDLVFSNDEAREKLAHLQNHIIRQEIYDRRKALLSKDKSGKALFMDIPLLIEQGYDGFDEIWLVAVPEEVQIERIMTRDKMTEAEAKARIRAQMPLSEKKKYATRIIDSSGKISETNEKIRELLKTIEIEKRN